MTQVEECRVQGTQMQAGVAGRSDLRAALGPRSSVLDADPLRLPVLPRLVKSWALRPQKGQLG